MADFDPIDILDIKSICSRLRTSGSRPSPGWRPWKEPSTPLPIDRYITALIKRDRAPKLRASEDLAHFHEPACPYAIARDGAYHAAFHAHIRAYANDDRAAATASLKAFSENARTARHQLLELYGHLDTVLQAQEHAFDPEVDSLQLLREGDRLLGAISALEGLERPFAQLHLRRSQNVGNVWQIKFASSLFGCWWCLTARDPSKSGPFSEFLDAAWQSLSDDELPILSWESAITTAKAQLEKEYEAKAPWRVKPKYRSCDGGEIAPSKPRF